MPPRKKDTRVFPNNIPPSKGVKKDPKSETIQHDAMSIKDMIRNHVQGILDPNEYNEGLYDPENIDHETDVSERSQKTLLDALDYANENAMSRDEIEDVLETLAPSEGSSTNEDLEALKTPLNDPQENTDASE